MLHRGRTSGKLRIDASALQRSETALIPPYTSDARAWKISLKKVTLQRIVRKFFEKIGILRNFDKFRSQTEKSLAKMCYFYIKNAFYLVNFACKSWLLFGYFF